MLCREYAVEHRKLQARQVVLTNRLVDKITRLQITKQNFGFGLPQYRKIPAPKATTVSIGDSKSALLVMSYSQFRWHAACVRSDIGEDIGEKESLCSAPSYR